MMPMILSANGSGILKCWADASFAVHPSMRGQWGGGAVLGMRIYHSKIHQVEDQYSKLYRDVD
jgi:hypothetical protein